MKKTWIMFAVASLLASFTCFSQDLFKERIRKIDGKKRGIYLDSGVFSLGKSTSENALTKIRHAYKAREGYERVVFDFASNDLAKIYSYMDKDKDTLYIDFFKTGVSGDVGSFGNSHFVKAIDIYPLENNQVAMEMKFKHDVGVEIFYLENPGRLVVDVKK